MRTFCLILILSNALFFSWSQLIDVHVSDLDRNVARNVSPPARIVLAREVATTPEPEDPARAATQRGSFECGGAIAAGGGRRDGFTRLHERGSVC